MNRFRLAALAAFVLAAPGPAHAALNIFACEPEWAALAQELGGDKVTVYAATNGLQDPHQVQAKPSLIARARNADLVACTGAELEVGWLPALLQQAGNAMVMPGQPGHFAAADAVRKLDVPSQLDRAQGDVHAAGLTVPQFTQALQSALETFVRQPNVSVEVANYRPFFILGEVQRPGTYPYSANLTALNAVATAGGLTTSCSTVDCIAASGALRVQVMIWPSVLQFHPSPSCSEPMVAPAGRLMVTVSICVVPGP